MAAAKLSIKLLIDTDANKVLLAEAGKDFVDFIFGLLSLPVGAVVKLLKDRSSVGCFGNLYRSFGNLNESYLQPNLRKDVLLNPKISSTSVTNFPLLMADTSPKKFYICNSGCTGYVTNVYCLSCPGHSYHQLTQEIQYVESNGVAPVAKSSTTVCGYVQGLAMYMVTDDLSVTPMSMVSSITMLNNSKVSKLDVLEERVVEVGRNEGLELLKASFQTMATLTAVFLSKEGVNDSKN